MTHPSRVRQKQIGNITYSITVMGAKKQIEVGQELIKISAPILGAIFDDSNKEFNFEDSSLFTEIALLLVNGMQKFDTIEIIDLLLKDAYKGSHPINDWDEEFAGDLYTLVSVVEFAFKENFGDFFTKYFKAKGLEIPTWENLKKKADSALKLNQESQENPQ